MIYGGQEAAVKKLLIIPLFLIILLCGTAVCAADYYVSSSGSDAADGLTSETAWRTLEKVNLTEFEPGDSILLKAGDAWNESLWVRGSGTEEEPIVIDMYGSGAKPLINGVSNAAVYLCNQQYVHICNLEITNSAEDEDWRYGVYVYGCNAGALGGIELRNLTVHDVSGKNKGGSQDTHWNGGIVVMARGNEKATRFVGTVIDGCTVYSVDRTGIVSVSNFSTDFDKQISGMSQGLSITNNTVYDISGDGIIVAGDYGGQVLGNTVFDTNMRQGGANVGIFAIHCTKTTVSENESYRSHTTNDGFGYDIDGDCDNVVFERNFSHDNEGGFLLLVNHNNNNAVARYNVSVNDKYQSVAVAAFDNVPESVRSLTAKVYNNTIYCAPSGRHLLINVSTPNAMPKKLELYNNIFYINSEGSVLNRNTDYTDKVVMSNNLYYGNGNIGELSETDADPVLDDPLFADIRSGEGRESAEGFAISAGSPCIERGLFVGDNGGYDFAGNLLKQYGSSDIGAFRYVE